MENYYQGCNTKLLARIPECRKVLELGCAAGLLGWHYKQEFPNAEWHGVDLFEEALAAAATRLDSTHLIHLDRQPLTSVGSGFDCVVLGDVLEHLVDPSRVLAQLYAITTEDAKIICCVPNMGHASVIERLISGDMSYDENGLLDKTHLRFFTKSSLVKLFLDSGWSPNVADRYIAPSGNTAFVQHIIEAAVALRLPQDMALENFSAYQYIFDCKKIHRIPRSDLPPISVIVALNDDRQLEQNILKSPGLKEINAEIILCRGAKSAADAFELGKEKASREWLMYCHQDVYFPSGFGARLQGAMNGMDTERKRKSVIGFAGLSMDEFGKTAHSGSVIDRGQRFDYPASERVVSLDELAIVMHKSCARQIDPELGWHLWATDLCLQGANDPEGVCYSQTVSEPIFHNSYSSYTLPEAYYKSAKILSKKYPDMAMIPTLCADIANHTMRPG
jgi:ubiquinone/menaquinone biosynthesis C-methylase UbiE